MSQFSLDYYKQLVDKEYKEYVNDSSGIDKEILCRNIISRVYYCAFLHCKNTLTPNIGHSSMGSHEKIIESLGEYFYSKVNRLKTQRIKADYHLNTFNTNTKFITKLKEEMEEVISANESELKTKN